MQAGGTDQLQLSVCSEAVLPADSLMDAAPSSNSHVSVPCCTSSIPGISSQQLSSQTRAHRRSTPCPDSSTVTTNRHVQLPAATHSSRQPEAAEMGPAAGQAAGAGAQVAARQGSEAAVQPPPAPAQQSLGGTSVLDQRLAKQHLAPVSNHESSAGSMSSWILC